MYERDLGSDNKMKNKIYHTVGTIPKFDQKIVDLRNKSWKPECFLSF